MSERKKKVVVAGSAANPVTRAHREFAEALTKSGEFDLVLWVPTGTRPDKPNLTDAAHRVRMTELAFDKEWRSAQPAEFRIDLRDAFRENTPTIYLLEELQKEFNDAQIIFATGGDVVEPRENLNGKCEVHFWDEGERLMKDWTFAVVPRPGYLHPKKLQEEGKIPKHFIVFDEELPGISSTEIRRRIKEGLPIDDLVHEKVGEYILTHGLYK